MSRKIKLNFQMIREFLLNNKLIFLTWSFIIVALFAFFDMSLNRDIQGYASIETVDINLNQDVIIRKIHVVNGDYVTKGKLLVELENKDLNIEILRKEAELKLMTENIKSIKTLNSNSLLSTLQQNSVFLKKELDVLKLKKENLKIYAKDDLIISSINFSNGEYVPAFENILTMQLKDTRTVHAFIPEGDTVTLRVGQKVLVRSYIGEKSEYARVKLISKELNLAPERLNEFEMLKEWGTKISLRLEKPSFLRGEKVMISTLNDKSLSLFNKAFAEEQNINAFKTELLLDSKYELSGIHSWGANHLLVVDDEGKHVEDSLFLYSINKKKIKEVKVDKNVRVSDVESVAVKGDFVYLVPSLSLNKKGNDKKSRNKIIVLKKKSKDEFEFIDKIDLRKPLINFLNSKMNLKNIDKKLDIESSFIFENKLFLGLKNTVSYNRFLVVAIPLASLGKKQLDGSDVFSFSAPVKNYGLSAMQFVNGEVYMAFNKGKKSGIYKSSLAFNKVRLLWEYDMKVEGIYLNKSDLYIAEDKGDSGHIFKVKVSR